jgi:hypothetical protein
MVLLASFVDEGDAIGGASPSTVRKSARFGRLGSIVPAFAAGATPIIVRAGLRLGSDSLVLPGCATSCSTTGVAGSAIGATPIIVRASLRLG